MDGQIKVHEIECFFHYTFLWEATYFRYQVLICVCFFFVYFKQTSDKDEKLICYIVNSAEYCHKTVSLFLYVLLLPCSRLWTSVQFIFFDITTLPVWYKKKVQLEILYHILSLFDLHVLILIELRPSVFSVMLSKLVGMYILLNMNFLWCLCSLLMILYILMV